MLIVLSYSYFDRVVNVAVMASELAFAIDVEARASTGHYCEPGALYRHQRDADGNKGWGICTSRSSFAHAQV